VDTYKKQRSCSRNTNAAVFRPPDLPPLYNPLERTLRSLLATITQYIFGLQPRIPRRQKVRVKMFGFDEVFNVICIVRFKKKC